MRKRFRNTNDSPAFRFCIPVIAVLSIVLILFLVLSFRSCSSTVAAGADSAVLAFNEKKDSTEEEAYQEFYAASYDKAEQQYHVSNDVTIDISDVKEIAKLEVLEVSTVEYIIENKTDNDSNITSWLEVPGTGVFTVDLMAGEYLVDKERKTVVVRIPLPRLENVGIDYENTEKLLFENDFFNDSYRAGADLYAEQIEEAYTAIYNELSTNPMYYENAENSARLLISNLVKEMNRDIPELTVEVEFME